jgi:thiol-disulfide isomerase/thioredoxin
LFDGNCDGLIRLNDGDKTIACENQENMSSRKSHGAIDLADTTLIKINDKVYEITRMDSLGGSVYLKPSKLKMDMLRAGDPVPDFAFLNTDSSQTTLYKQLDPKKYTLIYLWGSWCTPCTNALPQLQKIAEANSGNLNVIGLNTGERPETIRKYIEIHHVSWYTGMATKEIIKKLMVDAWPYYALVDKNKKIVRLYISLDDVEKILEKERESIK